MRVLGYVQSCRALLIQLPIVFFRFSFLFFSSAGTAAPEWAFSCTRLNSQWVHFQFAQSKVVIILWPANWNFLLMPHYFSCSPFEVCIKGCLYLLKTHLYVIIVVYIMCVVYIVCVGERVCVCLCVCNPLILHQFSQYLKLSWFSYWLC